MRAVTGKLVDPDVILDASVVVDCALDVSATLVEDVDYRATITADAGCAARGVVDVDDKGGAQVQGAV